MSDWFTFGDLNLKVLLGWTGINLLRLNLKVERVSRIVNLAIRSKQAWRIMQQPNGCGKDFRRDLFSLKLLCTVVKILEPLFRWEYFRSASYHLQAQPSVENILCRCLNKSLISWHNLFRKHIIKDPICPCCEKVTKTMEHLLTGCDWARFVCFGSPSNLSMYENPVHFVKTLFGLKLNLIFML